jgi:hypothetical protein
MVVPFSVETGLLRQQTGGNPESHLQKSENGTR